MHCKYVLNITQIIVIYGSFLRIYSNSTLVLKTNLSCKYSLKCWFNFEGLHELLIRRIIDT